MAALSKLAHPWNLSPTEAVALQKQLRERIDLSQMPEKPRTIAGVDISYNKFSEVNYAGIIVLDYDTQQPILHSTVVGSMPFPYIPGLLSFREIPAYIQAWEQLPITPDVVMVDGHGIAHPRRLGIGTHFGLVTDCPSLGCGKRVLTGKYAELAEEKGSHEPMQDRGETIGYALRTKHKVNPVFVSPGHKMSLADAVKIALHCARGYRIPEPTRQAHLLVNRLRRGEIKEGLKEY